MSVVFKQAHNLASVSRQETCSLCVHKEMGAVSSMHTHALTSTRSSAVCAHKVKCAAQEVYVGAVSSMHTHALSPQHAALLSAHAVVAHVLAHQPPQLGPDTRTHTHTRTHIHIQTMPTSGG